MVDGRNGDPLPLLSVPAGLGQAGSTREEVIVEIRGPAQRTWTSDGLSRGSRTSRSSSIRRRLKRVWHLPSCSRSTNLPTSAPETINLAKKVEPGTGWIVAVLVALFTIVWRFFEESIQVLCRRLVNWIYGGSRPIQAILVPALRKYRQALVRTYQELKIPFRQGRPLQMAEVFVPLKVNGSVGAERIDAQTALRRHQRLVVIGAPGAGKTMLMRHIALAFAREGLRDFEDQPIPILLELHRLTEPDRICAAIWSWRWSA